VTRTGAGGDGSRRSRGQLVLAAAALIAVALVPMVLSYHQLAYEADVEAADGADLDGAVAYLERAAGDASRSVAGEYGWTDRATAAATANETLGTHVDRLETAGLSGNVVYRVTQNETAARAWSGDDCPGGASRRFGPCEAAGGLVFQRRAGEAHLAAVALDLRVVADDESARLTVVIRGSGRRVGV
jgi:hypothetical protein